MSVSYYVAHLNAWETVDDTAANSVSPSAWETSHPGSEESTTAALGSSAVLEVSTGRAPSVDSRTFEGRGTDEGAEKSEWRAPDNQALGGHCTTGQSFYSFGPPGTKHNDFVRLVTSKLPYECRPQRPGRTLNDWIVGCNSLEQVLSLVAAHGNEFDCTNTSTAMHRIAKWYRQTPAQNLFIDSRWNLMLQHHERNLASYHTRHLSGALWSFATLAYRGPEVPRTFALARETLPEFTCTDLALTAWSMGTMKKDPPGLYEHISAQSIPKISEFSPQALSNITWATATLRKENDALVRSAAMIACRHFDADVHYKPHEYSTLVWSMVVSQAREDALMLRISEKVLRRVDDFGPQELVNTAWAFAALGIRPEGLFESIEERCRRCLAQFNTQNLTNLTWAYTHIGVGSTALLADVAQHARARIQEMNVQDLAQLSLSMVFVHRLYDTSGETRNHLRRLVQDVALGMICKLKSDIVTHPDDAWIVQDMVLVWMEEQFASQCLGGDWWVLDGYVKSLHDQVSEFLLSTPLLVHAKPCGAVVHTTHVREYEHAFKALDLRSLGIKYTSKLLTRLGLLDLDVEFVADAASQVDIGRRNVLVTDPGAGGQTWCVFRFELFAYVAGRRVCVHEPRGIQVRSCAGDPTALLLKEAPREAHFVAVKLSNDRLNHRKRDAEFRAMSHAAGLMRTLLPDVDELMVDRIQWGEKVSGKLQLFVSEVPCLSCLGAMVQFTKRFPNVQLRVSCPGISPAVRNEP